MLVHSLDGVFGKSDDIGKMAADVVLVAQPDDFSIPFRMVLRLVGRKQRSPLKRFDSYKDLKASRPPEEFHEWFIACNLDVTLNEERNLDSLLDHLLQKRPSVRVFIEIVRREHHHANAGGLRFSETTHGRVDGLAADCAARNFDHRTKVAGKGTAAGWINAQHWNDVPPQVALGWRYQNRCLNLLCPSLFTSIDRLQFALDRVLKDLAPYDFCFSHGETDAAVLKHARVARHWMRSTDDAMTNAVGPSKCCQVECAVKLVRLNPDECQHRRPRWIPKQVEICEIRLHILVYRVRFDWHAVDRIRRHAP